MNVKKPLCVWPPMLPFCRYNKRIHLYQYWRLIDAISELNDEYIAIIIMEENKIFFPVNCSAVIYDQINKKIFYKIKFKSRETNKKIHEYDLNKQFDLYKDFNNSLSYLFDEEEGLKNNLWINNEFFITIGSVENFKRNLKFKDVYYDCEEITKKVANINRRSIYSFIYHKEEYMENKLKLNLKYKDDIRLLEDKLRCIIPVYSE